MGRFYLKMPNGLAARAISVNPSVRADYFDEAGAQPVPDGVRLRSAPPARRVGYCAGRKDV